MEPAFQVALDPTEYLTRQFYEWELWGRGWIAQEQPVQLEPPFCPFPGHALPPDFFQDDGLESTFLSSLADGFRSMFKTSEPSPSHRLDESERVPQLRPARRDLAEMTITFAKNAEPSVDVFQHCLAALVHARDALSFEIVAAAQKISFQLVAGLEDANPVARQLKAHFPEAAIVPSPAPLAHRWAASTARHWEVREFGLDREFYMPLLSPKRLAIDSLAALFGALDDLAEEEIAVYQVLFEPVRHDWATHLVRALTVEDGSPFFGDAPESVQQAKSKIASPLYAVVVRVAAKTNHPRRTWEILKGLAGALTLLADPQGNRLVLLENEGYPDAEREPDLLNRVSRRFGMILNAQELVSLAHLPSSDVAAPQLERRLKRSKAPPPACLHDGILLGRNEHEGKSSAVRLGLEQRLRHVHVIGNSGTGKSTFLLNLICQDIYQNHGVAVLDPHGDLIDDLLPYIPPERWNDVILFDAADDAYPIGFNILSAHSELEKTLLASDLVDVFRRLSTSWGDQMRSVLGNAILAFLESTRTGTLPELRRFLIEPNFRKEVLGHVTDPEVVYYWEREFPLLKSQSVGPLLTRLDEFLRRKTIRYVVGQAENRLDFGKMMEQGQIFLAKLPQGLIGEENSYMLGSLLVSKFHQLAIARQEKEKSSRRPFFLFLDEFHHFITPTLETILSGGRKYGLGLTLAHQGVHQLERAGGVGQGVLSLCGSRVCFRVGDDDARKLADGFASFERTDLQSLENYEALCRIDRREHDFNLRTIKPPELDGAADWRRDYLRYLSRLRYGTPRQDVEEQLARSRGTRPAPQPIDPFAKRTAGRPKSEASGQPVGDPEREQKAEPVPEKPQPVAVPPAPQPKAAEPIPPKAEDASGPLSESSSQHESIKRRILEEADALGYSAESERPVLDGKGRVDVALERGTLTIACEVSVTTTVEHEVQNVSKCFQARFQHVAVICLSRKRLDAIRKAVEGCVDAGALSRVGFYLPTEFLTTLQDWVGQDSKAGGTGGSRKRRSGIHLTSPEMTDTDRRQREKAMLSEMTERLRRKRP